MGDAAADIDLGFESTVAATRMAIWEFLGPDALPRLRRYFDFDSGYAAELFDSLPPNPPDRLVAADLLALNLLNMQATAPAIRWLLGGGRDWVSERLARVPATVDLWDAPLSVLSDGSPLDELWRRLRSFDGVGWVTAGKLLARKRPRLVPIYDSVLRTSLGQGADRSFWLVLRAALRDERTRARLTDLRARAGIDASVPLLRVLDVAIWMASSREARRDRHANPDRAMHPRADIGIEVRLGRNL
jgi:hypothetical protein